MRKTWAGLIAGIFLLAGCAGQTPPTQEQLSEIAQRVEAYTQQFCNFQPSAAALLQLIGAFYQPGQAAISVANSIGAAICNAPITSSYRRGARRAIARAVTTPDGQVVIVTDRRSVRP